MADVAIKDVDSPPPQDTWSMAYLTFFCLGLGILMPWNAFVTAVDYFSYIYPDMQIGRLFSIFYMLPMLISMVLLVFFGSKASSSTRVSLGYAINAVLLVSIPMIDILGVGDGYGKGTKTTLVFTLFGLTLVGCNDALLQGSTFAFAGELPRRFTQGILGGTSSAGIFVSLLRTVTRAMFSLRVSALLYFCFTCAFQLFCLASFHATKNLPVIKYYRSWGAGVGVLHDSDSVDNMGDLVLATPKDPSKAAKKSAPPPPPPQQQQQQQHHHQVKKKKKGLEKLGGGSIDQEALLPERIVLEPEGELRQTSSYWHVLLQIKGYAAGVLWIYMVTLSIFPGFLTEDVHSKFFGTWYPVLVLTSYNIGDFSGSMSSLLYVIESREVVMRAALCRGMFFPLFGLCKYGPAFCRTEFYVFFITVALGLSNGYLTSLVMQAAPKQVAIRDAEMAGTLMVLALVTGLTIGSFGGWIWVYLPPVFACQTCLLGAVVVWTAALLAASAMVS